METAKEAALITLIENLNKRVESLEETRMVMVKILEDIKKGFEEFRNELSN